MKLNKVYQVTWKDIKETFSSVLIFGPMFGIPLAFAIILPVLSLYIAVHEAPSIAAAIKIPNISAALPAFKSIAFMDYFSINILGPITMTMPIITSAVIAADSFAGEKERKTAESLLSTPLSKTELLLGKIFASFLPAVIMAVIAFALYGSIVNYLAFQQFHLFILPTLPWLLMLAAVPFLALAPISIVVLISSHVKGVKEAQQLTSLLVLPLLVLPFASLLGLASLSVSFMLYLILFLAIFDFVLFYVSLAVFHRESLIS
ncbi:MAG: ABC transporter permease subunit [Candidatus Parvarchaeota archaeon]|nr:ABC transporter permease subunit [Candidatus Parvarchaeum tengchongense]MCW1295425.1 ABC transporter permease subunit [Candidatus Parvarchaeum tengchongense]MCW1299606.1 ABC transporter permease subunit [Candidatus Parvarchaeum tengchongense]MCW1312298.1 ABC transporter permease subunit [Candidatus Parvarchaeum tengchongense]